MKIRSLALAISAVVAIGGHAESVLEFGDRIVLIGDSITGQGWNVPDGWAHVIDDALATDYPNGDFELIALGGSGQGVGTWQGVEKTSRSEPLTLDVKDVDVKATLDEPADVVIFMLGMNDVLAPRIQPTAEAYDQWESDYLALIEAVRTRVNPRVIAIATPTLCTEVVGSPKNEAMDALIARIKSMAEAEKLTVLPTNAAMVEILKRGRRFQPDFHVTNDSVHPNQFGHMAIAAGMLQGLGEDVAAERIVNRFQEALERNSSNALSWEVTPTGREGSVDVFAVSFSAPGAKATESATLSAPDGWIVQLADQTDDAGSFEVRGNPDHLVTELALSFAGREAGIRIPAPWLIGVSDFGREGWNPADGSFDSNQGAFPTDVSLAGGEGWNEPLELAPGHPVTWARYFPRIGFGGDDRSGAIDLASVLFYQNFAVAYGARWIFSDREVPARIALKTTGFGNGEQLGVWWNGESQFDGIVGNANGRGLPVTIRKGWNLLAFKSNHLQWQWQFEIEFRTENPADIDDLLVSAIPPES